MLKRILMTALCAGLTANAHAHFMWLEIPAAPEAAAALRFAEEPAEGVSQGMQEKSIPMQVVDQAGNAVEFAYGEDALTATVLEGTTILSGFQKYGVLDRGEEGRGKFLLNYYAKGLRDKAEAGTVTGAAVEITAAWTEDRLVVTVWQDGKAVPASEVWLDTNTTPETIERVTDDHGVTSFPLPAPGWIGIRALVIDETPGEHEGDDYPAVRSYATLTVEVGE